MRDLCTNFFLDETPDLPITFRTLSSAHKQKHISTRSKFHQIFITLGGHGVVRCIGKEYELKRSTGFFNADDNFIEYYGSEDFLCAYITAQGTIFPGLLERLNCDRFIYFDSINIEKYVIEIKQIEKEYNNRRCNDVISSLTYSLFVDFLNQNSANNDDALSKIVNYIENNFNKKLTLNSLANVGHISKSSLTHKFKEKYNMTVFEYIMHIRLEQANIYVLSMTDMSVKDIAFAVGFDTVNYFCDLYKKRYGVSPSKKRKELCL